MSNSEKQSVWKSSQKCLIWIFCDFFKYLNFRAKNGQNWICSFNMRVIFKHCTVMRQRQFDNVCFFMSLSDSKMLLFLQLRLCLMLFKTLNYCCSVPTRSLIFGTKNSKIAFFDFYFQRSKDCVHNEWLFPDLKTFLRGVEKRKKKLSKELNIRWGNCEEEELEIEGKK